jgi:hypothetical protein
MSHLSVFPLPCSASNTETQHHNRSLLETNRIKIGAIWDKTPYMFLKSYQYFGGKNTAAAFRFFFCHENGGNSSLQNVGNYLPNQTASHPIKQ